MIVKVLTTKVKFLEPSAYYPLLNCTFAFQTANFILFGFMAYPYLPNPSAQAGYDTRSIFKQSLTGLNSEISFS